MMDFLTRLEALRFSEWVLKSDSIWAFPMFLFMHTLGMGIVAGLSAAIDLRLLGLWPQVPIRPLERLFPFIWIGFWINAVTGTVMMIADATTKLTNWDFYVKMVLVFAGVWLLSLTRKRVFGDPGLDKGQVPSSARGLAWASLICWFGAITAGRLLAYVGPVSGLPGVTTIFPFWRLT
jgi:hypothetical protein